MNFFKKLFNLPPSEIELENNAKNKLGINHGSHYKYDNTLDKYLTACIKSGIHSILKEDNYYIEILFNNKIYVKIWNSNKYYAWLNSGEIYEYDQDESKNIIYKYNDKRPSYIVMFKLKEKIENFYGNKLNV